MNAEADASFGLTSERLEWLIKLRWIALVGICAATGLSAAGMFPGVNWPVLAATGAAAGAYNLILIGVLRRTDPVAVRRLAPAQALVDFLLLTVALWSAGGLDCPFVSYYVFHVALVGILSGPRATVFAAVMALACVGLLGLTELFPVLRIGRWDPRGAWHLTAEIAAFVSTLGAVAYLVTHAVRQLHDARDASMLRERQLLRAEQLASLGRVAQGAAHELNTPLATIRTLAADMGAALKDIESADDTSRQRLIHDVNESASLIRDETARLGRITRAMLAGGDLSVANVKEAVPLAAVVERSSALVFAGARRDLELVIDPSIERVELSADRDRLVQVLVNLLQNANDAVREGGGKRVVIAAPRSDAGRVHITVEDDGPGIDPSIRDRLFEPFTTTKPAGEGTGLGLYTSYMLVRAMNGTLVLERGPTGGTRATITLPA